MMNNALTVTQLNEYVSGMMSHDPVLRSIVVCGEVSNWRRTASGHIYFALKDENAVIRCVFFKRNALLCNEIIKDGAFVSALGYVALYVKDGQYQLYVQSIRVDGAGDLNRQFEQLKAKLDTQGYFELARKRKIPGLPRRVGIVTSPTGAVIEDIQKVCARRFAGIPLLLCPAKVQGEGASLEIVNAIHMLNHIDDIDVIIVGRGGGSIEDLWCFNEEIVADAIYSSQKPVISAVGHETDFTIADFVADMRAPTPSAAAELVVPVKSELVSQVAGLRNRLAVGLRTRFDGFHSRLALLSQSSAFLYPLRKIESAKQNLDYFEDRLLTCYSAGHQKLRNDLASFLQRLDSASPLAVLRRGYAIATCQNKLVTGVSALHLEDSVTLTFKDGEIAAQVQSIRINA